MLQLVGSQGLGAERGAVAVHGQWVLQGPLKEYLARLQLGSAWRPFHPTSVRLPRAPPLLPCRYVFGMGTLQVVLTLLGVAGVAMAISGLPGPGAIILGGALAMSSTAVAIQVGAVAGCCGADRCVAVALWLWPERWKAGVAGVGKLRGWQHVAGVGKLRRWQHMAGVGKLRWWQHMAGVAGVGKLHRWQHVAGVGQQGGR